MKNLRLSLAIFFLVTLGCWSNSDRFGESHPPPEPISTKAPATDAERLAEAKAILEGKDESVAAYNDAENYLNAIGKSAPEYKEARKLLVDLKKRRDEIVRQVQKKDSEERKIKRKEVISKLEQNLLSQGMDFYFTFEGQNQEILRVRYVLMSRPVVYKITNETDFLTTIASLGVRKVIFTDGYDSSWTYDL